jgi:hypothetical protein
MQVGSEKAFGAGYNVLPIWKRRLNAKTLVTTPNSDVLYAMSYVNLADGPLVMDAPPGLQGILLDFWQRPIPVDGGKFRRRRRPVRTRQRRRRQVSVAAARVSGRRAGRSLRLSFATNNVFVFLRGFYGDPNELGPAVAHLEQTKIYPLRRRGRRQADDLPRCLRRPGHHAADQRRQRLRSPEKARRQRGHQSCRPGFAGMLASIGIVKGRPFEPDARTREILDRAAKTAYKMSRVTGFQDGESGRSYRVYPDRRWLNPFADGTPANPSGPLNLAWRIPPRGISTSMRVSGCSPTTIRSAQGWCPKRRAKAPNT